jgi:UDP-N-acetylmuramoyl-tripeptide--D-alanyl-D-alanine ligase
MLLVSFLAVITALFAGWRAWRRLAFFLHVFQLEGYKPPEFRRWVAEHAGTVFVRLSHKLALIELVLITAGVLALSPYWTAVVALPLWAITFASSRLYRREREKKPLKYTNRMMRLLGAAGALAAAPVVAGLLAWILGDLTGVLWFLSGFFLADFLAPMWVLLAELLMRPVETSVQEGFKREARRRLRRRRDLQVVSITGSYGKTSTKFVVREILAQRYNVLATPSSYNTPMGLCLVVNEMLRAEHQVLVLEMGIRHPGDMDELCEIVRPHVGVVTSVGIAHLESMGSIDEIAKEKAKMIESLTEDGIAVLNADDERVAAMGARAPGRVWLVSARDHPAADLTASDIQYGRDGARFLVRDDTGEERRFRTRLLGEHNVTNILLAIAVGRAMDLRLRQMVYAVERLEPIEHRLQLREDGPITIIDDAFNSNPVGARNAVQILGRFDAGRRVIVTPGMIELGERQWEENRIFGEHIAEHVDLAVLVGSKQTAPIQEGLRAKQFPESSLKIVDSLWDAQSFLKTYLREGDVVLYENDLPDQFG